MGSQKVAFLCLQGSAKSLIAAENFNRIAIERNLPLRATTAGPEPDEEVPQNVVVGLKSRGIDVGQYRPTLIAAEQLSDTSRIVSFACDAGRRLAPSKPGESWDECPAVSENFDVAWTFITGRVEKLISRLSAQ
jgi:arsenate reductase